MIQQKIFYNPKENEVNNFLSGFPKEKIINVSFHVHGWENSIDEITTIFYIAKSKTVDECEDCGKPWKIGDPTSEVEERRIKCVCKECF